LLKKHQFTKKKLQQSLSLRKENLSYEHKEWSKNKIIIQAREILTRNILKLKERKFEGKGIKKVA
jgi:hypothetical protein